MESRVCEKHGVERIQRYKDGTKCGTRCPECDKENSKKRRTLLTPEQRAAEAVQARIYRETRLTDDQRRLYNENKKQKRASLSEEERALDTRRRWLKYTYGLTRAVVA